jgi:hypothetical protein
LPHTRAGDVRYAGEWVVLIGVRVQSAFDLLPVGERSDRHAVVLLAHPELVGATVCRAQRPRLFAFVHAHAQLE